jgi:hypothetical protein
LLPERGLLRTMKDGSLQSRSVKKQKPRDNGSFAMFRFCKEVRRSIPIAALLNYIAT